MLSEVESTSALSKFLKIVKNAHFDIVNEMQRSLHAGEIKKCVVIVIGRHIHFYAAAEFLGCVCMTRRLLILRSLNSYQLVKHTY